MGNPTPAADFLIPSGQAITCCKADSPAADILRELELLAQYLTVEQFKAVEREIHAYGPEHVEAAIYGVVLQEKMQSALPVLWEKLEKHSNYEWAIPALRYLATLSSNPGELSRTDERICGILERRFGEAKTESDRVRFFRNVWLAEKHRLEGQVIYPVPDPLPRERIRRLALEVVMNHPAEGEVLDLVAWLIAVSEDYDGISEIIRSLEDGKVRPLAFSRALVERFIDPPPDHPRSEEFTHWLERLSRGGDSVTQHCAAMLLFIRRGDPRRMDLTDPAVRARLRGFLERLESIEEKPN